jgi:hypothetical protein
MALRDFRGARLRHLAHGRPRVAFALAAVAVYLAAGISATWPAVLHARSAFLSGGAPGHGEAAAGDHLQTLYHWWLVGHQLEHGHAPWLDPYSFRPEAAAQPNYPGWPFGFVFWPLSAAFGSVVGWNLVQLLIYVLAGLVTCAWLRELGLPRAPALAGGVAFAIAPYRVQQSVGHLLGPISIMLPLSLWAFERARRGRIWWLALSGAALVSIPLSGQVHLALGAIPFFLAYVAVRLRDRWACVPIHIRRLAAGGVGAIVAAIGAGVLVQQTVIAGSTQSSGRSLHEVSVYSARVGDFFARNVDHARSEQYVYLGWATPLLALAGLALLLRARRMGLGLLLAAGAAVPVLLALGTHLPTYAALWHALPPFRFPRVPERLLPIACLCIAALVAFALARASALVVLLAVALLFVDLHARVYGRSSPGHPVRLAAPAGRLLELPVFDPGIHYGSVYLWYDTVALRQRPGGYSTTAPLAAKALMRRIERLNCGDWSDHTSSLLHRLGVTAIQLHLGLFVRSSAVPNRSYFAWRGLVTHGWGLEKVDGPVWTFLRGAARLHGHALLAPSTSSPVFCQGWYGNTGSGWPMSETHAPFWIYGAGPLRLQIGAPASLYQIRNFDLDGKPFVPNIPGGRLVISLGARARWHLVVFNVAQLVQVGKRRIGLTLLSVSTCPSRGSPSRRRASCR